MTAADLLNPDHPLHPAFKVWVEKKGTELNKRQARKFLASLPDRGKKYRTAA